MIHKGVYLSAHVLESRKINNYFVTYAVYRRRTRKIEETTAAVLRSVIQSCVYSSGCVQWCMEEFIGPTLLPYPSSGPKRVTMQSLVQNVLDPFMNSGCQSVVVGVFAGGGGGCSSSPIPPGSKSSVHTCFVHAKNSLMIKGKSNGTIKCTR